MATPDDKELDRRMDRLEDRTLREGYAFARAISPQSHRREGLLRRLRRLREQFAIKREERFSRAKKS